MTHDQSGVTRRSVLRASSGAVGVPVLDGVVDGDADSGAERCPDATVEPSMGHCEGASEAACADDHPETVAIRESVAETLETDYPTVGSLIEDGFVPYFDLLTDGDEDGYSHWLNPAFISDGTVLDPERPESVLVDNKWWRPIGAMFIATVDGERLDSPPAVYETDEPCSPWHYHAGKPGRFAWWYYRTVHAPDHDEVSFRLPCRTPCMLHVWTHPHPNGVYAHGPPPRGKRGGPPAEDPGFETAATPGEDDLGWKVLPEYYVRQTKPGDWLADLLLE
jgi:hypothetical protein